MALLFKACPLLSDVSAYAADPCGRFIAAQGTLSGSHVTMASVYAPVERQERAPFLQQSLLPAMSIGTPLLLGGDWNWVAQDMDLVGGQPGTRQHGFQSGLLPFQQALSLHDAFRCLHPQAREFTHTATNNASSARIDRCRAAATACFQMSVQLQSQTVSCQNIMECHLPMHLPAVQGFGQCLLALFPFKTLMTAHIQTFFQTNPVTTTLSRAAR